VIFGVAAIVIAPLPSISSDTPPRTTEIHQQVLVLDGVLEATVGDARYRLAAGDCLALQLDRHNGYRNPGRKTVRYLVAIATR